MRPHGKKTLARILSAAGALLMTAAVLAILVPTAAQKRAAVEATELVAQLRNRMPEIRDAIPDGRTDTTMPTVAVDGQDFAGIVAIPAYGTELPLCGIWSRTKVYAYPCRYAGSLYDRHLVIGGSEAAGQLDCMDRMTGGDLVTVTDMTGLRYTYTVTDVEKTGDVSAERLLSADTDLTLFARSRYGFEYTVVRCTLKSGG